MEWELWEFLGVGGLDRKTGVRDQGTGVSKSKGKGPGLKPVSSLGGFRGLKPPAPSGNDKNG
jgi:hypothetical protein